MIWEHSFPTKAWKSRMHQSPLCIFVYLKMQVVAYNTFWFRAWVHEVGS